MQTIQLAAASAVFALASLTSVAHAFEGNDIAQPVSTASRAEVRDMARNATRAGEVTAWPMTESQQTSIAKSVSRDSTLAAATQARMAPDYIGGM